MHLKAQNLEPVFLNHLKQTMPQTTQNTLATP